MEDCKKCFLAIESNSFPNEMFCAERKPSVITYARVVDAPFNITIVIASSSANDCDFLIIWRHFPIEETCCDEVSIASASLPFEMAGKFTRLSRSVNGKAAYFGHKFGVHGERPVLSATSNASWILSSTKYIMPGNDLAMFALLPSNAICAEQLKHFVPIDPFHPRTIPNSTSGSSLEATCINSK